MIEGGNENKKVLKKYRWNHFDHIPIQSLLGPNHRLPLFHMTKRFIWLEETKERINKFSIGYMINPTLDINKSFREQVNKCMKILFGEITQPHIKTTLGKSKTKVLALIMFYETR